MQVCCVYSVVVCKPTTLQRLLRVCVGNHSSPMGCVETCFRDAAAEAHAPEVAASRGVRYGKRKPLTRPSKCLRTVVPRLLLWCIAVFAETNTKPFGCNVTASASVIVRHCHRTTTHIETRYRGATGRRNVAMQQ